MLPMARCWLLLGPAEAMVNGDAGLQVGLPYFRLHLGVIHYSYKRLVSSTILNLDDEDKLTILHFSDSRFYIV